MKLSKRVLQNNIEKKINNINIDDIINNIKKFSNSKFIESIDLSILLNIKKINNFDNLSGYITLPNKIGNKLKIGILENDKNKIELINNYNIVDYIGMDNILEDYINKKIFVNLFISNKESLNKINKNLILKLNFKNIFPNNEWGTILKEYNYDVINNIKYYTIFYKSNKNGIINIPIAKSNFDSKIIKENLIYFLNNFKKNKIINNRLFLIKKIFINSTMGISIEIPKIFL